MKKKMGIFSVFRSKKNSTDLANFTIGYFRTETSKLLGIKPNTKEYDDALQSATEPIKTSLVSCLNKQIQQDIANTLNSISSKRFNELFGEYIFLLFVRFSVISRHIMSGKVKAEEATPDILANVIHGQIKNLIHQIK